MSEEYFKKALRDFTVDFASGGAIKAMADKGYTVEEIHNKLDFPTSRERIREIVWKHYIDTGVIALEEPVKGQVKSRATYEKVTDDYGRTSYRQVVTSETIDKEYVACDFGKMMYKDKEGLEKKLESLSQKDREYLTGLPWPLTRVWHVKDERIMKILEILTQSDQ